MKYNINYKVEFKTKKTYYGSSIRNIYYRIVPSELPFWKRIFFNPWTEIYKAYYSIGGFKDGFSCEEYYKEIFPLKTFGDVCDYLKKQHEISQKNEIKCLIEKQKQIEKGKCWPD